MMLSRILLALVCLTALAEEPGLEVLEKAGRWRRIKAHAEARLKTNPKDAEAELWLSRALEQAMDFEGALKAARLATELNPALARAWEQRTWTATLRMRQVGKLAKLGFVKEIKQAAEKALALDPKNRTALETLEGYYREVPSILGGDKAKSDAHLRTIDAMDPEAPYSRELEAAQRSRDPKRIEAALHKGLANFPKSPKVLGAAAQYYERSNPPQKGEAERLARRALDLSIDEPTANLVLHLLLFQQERWKDLEQTARKRLEHFPGSVEGHWMLIHSLMSQGRFPEMEEALKKVETACPDNWVPYIYSAKMLLEKKKDPKRAELYARRYLGQEPEFRAPDRASAHWLLSWALEQQGRLAEAKEQLRIALQIRPTFEQAKKDLERLG